MWHRLTFPQWYRSPSEPAHLLDRLHRDQIEQRSPSGQPGSVLPLDPHRRRTSRDNDLKLRTELSPFDYTSASHLPQRSSPLSAPRRPDPTRNSRPGPGSRTPTASSQSFATVRCPCFAGLPGSRPSPHAGAVVAQVRSGAHRESPGADRSAGRRRVDSATCRWREGGARATPVAEWAACRASGPAFATSAPGLCQRIGGKPDRTDRDRWLILGEQRIDGFRPIQPSAKRSPSAPDVTLLQVFDQRWIDRLAQACHDHDRFLDHRHVLRMIERVDVKERQDRLAQPLAVLRIGRRALRSDQLEPRSK